MTPFGWSRERELFAQNVSMLVDSGMDMLSVLRAAKEEVRGAGVERRLSEMEEDIASGSTLWSAFERCRLFPPHIVSLLRVGEESGRLAENLRVIANTLEKERLFRSRIRSAMLYPVFVLALAFSVGTWIAWFILPNLATVFAQLRIDLPLVTRLLIAFGTFLGERGAVVVPAFLLLAALSAYFLFFFPRTRWVGQGLLYGIPGIHRLLQELELSRMGYVAGSLLTAGLTLPDTLRALEEAAGVRSYRAFYRSLREHIENGDGFSRCFSAIPHARRFVKPSIQHLLEAGEKSGKLPEAFEKIGRMYESKTEDTTKNLAVILEPVLLVVVWLGVVAVALAVILPIYTLVGGFNQNL